MEVFETAVKLIRGEGQVREEEFNKIVPEIDRANLGVIIDEIVMHTNGQPLNAEVLIVGGILNKPGGEHKDLDVKISMKRGNRAGPTREAIESAIKSLTEKGWCKVEKTKESSRLAESGYVETYNFITKGKGTIIEIIPPYGAEDLAAEDEVKWGRGRNRRYYPYRSI